MDGGSVTMSSNNFRENNRSMGGGRSRVYGSEIQNTNESSTNDQVNHNIEEIHNYNMATYSTHDSAMVRSRRVSSIL